VDNRAGLDRGGKSRPPPGFDPRTVQLVASRYTDCAIPVRSSNNSRSSSSSISSSSRIIIISSSNSRSKVQAVGRRPLTAVAWGQWQASPYEMCDGQSDTGLGFSFR
jgi:hypothetical protein